MTEVRELRESRPADGNATAALAEALIASRREAQQLRLALETRVVIEQAKGVLAERFGTTVDVAFELLRRGARSSQRRIHDLADEVLRTERTPPAILRERERLGR